MNVIKEIQNLTINDKDDIQYIIDTLKIKIIKLSMSEPKSYGEAYDRWEERCDDLEYIIDDLEELETEEDLDKVRKSIREHQAEYGGLIRLR